MDLPRTLAFSLIALVVIAIPGPSVLFIVSRAVSLGRRAALGTVLGNSLGEFAQVVVVALGMGQLLQRSAAAFTAVKLVGAGYLIYLGLRAWARRRSVASELMAPTARRSDWRILRDGLVVGATNPKTMVFIAAVLPDFVDRSLGHVTVQLMILGLVWVSIALISDGAWGMAAGTARGWLVDRPRHLQRAQTVSAVVMVGLGVGLAVSSRTS
ncbi:MAG: LysE family translocator [Candidatus Dormiibacterota bacterium]